MRCANDSIPGFVVLRAGEVLNKVGKPLMGAGVFVAGVSYKPSVGDTREMPAIPVIRRFAAVGADVSYVDPFVSDFEVDRVSVARADDLLEAAESCDLLIALTPHDALPVEEAALKAPRTLDTRGRIPHGGTVERL